MGESAAYVAQLVERRRAMNRIARLAVVAALSLGCRDTYESTAPLRPHDLTYSPAVVANLKIDAVVFASLLCGTTREEFLTRGKLHILVATETDSDGGTHFKLHFNSAKLTGENIRTGEEIQLRFTNNTEANGRFDGARESTVTATTTAVIGDGPDARHLVAHATIHVTMNANGEVTAVVSNIFLECR
jgi:hypothetical protein